jgi:hypothetical protein
MMVALQNRQDIKQAADTNGKSIQGNLPGEEIVTVRWASTAT